MEKNYFAELYNINVNDKVEKKNGLSYVSWPFAWAEVKKLHPTATYTVYENKDGWNYHNDGRTAWVKTGVTVDGIEHIEYLPVMDHRNKSIPLDAITSFDVNKAIQRSLTKACARHGLGLYIYAGEDLPEDELQVAKEEAKTLKPEYKPDDKVDGVTLKFIVDNMPADRLQKALEYYKVDVPANFTKLQAGKIKNDLLKKGIPA